MAVGAELECHWLLEVATVMAGSAIDLLVLTLKRILGCGMIEFRVESGGLLPRDRGMASFAGLLERPTMRISMTVCAAAKLYASITENSICAFGMALLTIDADVGTGQWIFRLRVVKDLVNFPVVCVVALFAAQTQLPMMFVFVATCAALG